jgi:hypothetical protein
MSGTFPVRHEHWPEPPRHYQAVAVIALLLIVIMVTLF